MHVCMKHTYNIFFMKTKLFDEKIIFVNDLIKKTWLISIKYVASPSTSQNNMCAMNSQLVHYAAAWHQFLYC